MGVGKSTTAHLLVERLGWPLRDSDVDIARLFGVTGADIARRHGVEELHRVEAAVLLGALASETPAVITAASSVIDDPRCREAMGRCADVVVLDATDELLESRRSAGDHRRAIDADAFRALVARRRPLYDRAADLCLEATGSPSALVDAIIDAFATGVSGSAGPREG
jgi:shikimate kinase